MADLEAKVRSHGLDDFRQVSKAYLESDGEFTVVKRERKAEKRNETAKDRAV